MTALQENSAAASKIVLVKLYSGDMILGEKDQTTASLPTHIELNTSLNNPRMVAIAPTMTGQVRIALGSVCEPFNVKRLKEFISIPKTQIMFELSEEEIDKELVNGYKSEVSGIKIASTSDMAALNGTPKPGSFTL